MSTIPSRLSELNRVYALQERTGLAHQKSPQNTVSLQRSTVKADAEEEKDRDLRYCFRVVSMDRMYLLQVPTCYYTLPSQTLNVPSSLPTVLL